MRRMLSLSTSILALVCCGAAHAQTASGSSSEIASDNGLEVVVVTAERRATNLQKTAISATVLTGADLENKGVAMVDQLQFIAPSVTINNFGQGMDFNIRGIGKAEHNTQTTTGVITYRDGVATFPGYVQEEPYYDIASIQVLRGPQGTLVGSNATGGAVFVTSNDPAIDGGYDGYLQGQVGNYADVGFQGAVNLPINDKLAARIAVFGERRDSFYDIKGPGGAKYTGNPGDLQWGAARLSVLWKPTSHLSVLFKADADYLDNGAYPADPYIDRFRLLPGTTTPNPSYTDLFKITANSPQQGLDRFVRTSLKVDYVFPDGITLRSISAFQKATTSYIADLDGTSAGNSFFADSVHETIWSQEVNLISPDTGRVTWVLGAYAQADTYNFLSPYKFVIGTPLGNPLSEYRLQGRNPKIAFAGFGQMSVKLPAGFELQAGARYSFASTKNDVDILQYGLPIADRQKAKYYNLSYKASLNWNVNDNNFLYALVATGFRPGGLNVPVGLGLPAPFKQETVTDYEIGWKSTMLDGHLRTQVDAFYDPYKNFQVRIGYPAIPVFAIELNVPHTTTIYGFEGEAQAAFGALSFDVGVGVMHSSLGEFYATDPRVAAFAACDPATGPAGPSCIALKGRQQTYAPNFTFNVGAQYEFTLNGGDTLTPRLNYGHVSDQWATLFEEPALGDRIGSRNILNGQLAWAHGSWIATLYGTNLTDEHYVGALNTGLDFAGPPRQFGIRILKVF